MFHATWTTPVETPAGTLRFSSDPRLKGLGIYKDVDGIQWDIRGITGRYVQARRIADAPEFYSTATNEGPTGFHRWDPYEIEVVNAE